MAAGERETEMEWGDVKKGKCAGIDEFMDVKQEEREDWQRL